MVEIKDHLKWNWMLIMNIIKRLNEAADRLGIKEKKRIFKHYSQLLRVLLNYSMFIIYIDVRRDILGGSNRVLDYINRIVGLNTLNDIMIICVLISIILFLYLVIRLEGFHWVGRKLKFKQYYDGKHRLIYNSILPILIVFSEIMFRIFR